VVIKVMYWFVCYITWMIRSGKAQRGNRNGNPRPPYHRSRQV